jgi:hypothetical protein
MPLAPPVTSATRPSKPYRLAIAYFYTVLVMWPVTLPGSWFASTKRCKDAGSADSRTIGATEDAAARRVIVGQGPGERCRLHH